MNRPPPTPQTSCFGPPCTPQCDSLEGFRVHAVAAGVGFTLVLTSAEDKERVAKLPVFESVAPEEEAVAEEEAGEEGRAGIV